ncbi:O-mycaminosyltylonolide 6-deoxyallosyltransferase [Arthrobacter sp. SO5]|uniref:glycosyltransferase n=1 Tax=Arthrobacter sp. SO5 TaxID=1897055 RepID=UPI001E54D919|nr:glycosyltransferase [Arthrobacter sp. SO5]MCB5273494.1 O-mycaminosyltylonolide 6-deoxyallosyltransferase [Arthrobacter sp. SO5]
MRILLATAGSRGDVEPFAALARRAIAEGHQARLVAPDNSGADLSGLDVASMGVDYSRMIEDQGVSLGAAIRSFRSVVRPIMRGVIVESARAAMEYRPDVIVSHPKVLSATLVSEALGIPHVLVEIVPSVTPTLAFPAAGTVTRSLGILNPLTYGAAAASAALFRGDLDEVAKLVGVPRRPSAPPAATVLPISPAILGRPDDWPDNVHLTGAWNTESARVPLPVEVAEFVARGGFVYAGFGSMAAGDPVARAKEVVRGIRDYGARAMLACGLGGLEVPSDLLGNDVLVVSSVDHRLVLPHAEAAVHHGGIGTVHAATRASTVSVVVPFIADQPFWGARLHARGLSPAPIPRKRLTAAQLTSTLENAGRYRTAVAAASLSMADEDGTGAALAVIANVL